MADENHRPPQLTVIRGGLVRSTWLGRVKVVAAPKDHPPFPVEAMVFEEDTFLVLSSDPTVRDPKVPLVRILTRLMETQPETPGTVLVKGGVPIRLLAVVHDLNEDPSWREEWIAAALARIFQNSERRGFHSLALPLLGTMHGRLGKDRALALLTRHLTERPPARLRRIWLVVPPGCAPEIIGLIEDLVR